MRQHNPTNDHPPDYLGGHDPGRLNLLLSCEPPSRPTDEWSSQLPRLLEPMGVTAVRAGSGAEAARVIRSTQIHIAIVDLSIPLEHQHNQDPDQTGPALAPQEGGRRILQLLSRLDAPPPTLVVKARRTKREDARALQSALTAGAFAVLDRPVNLETVLRAMGRAVRKHYADRWPDA